jgi:acyl-CoA dehydrogenase
MDKRGRPRRFALGPDQRALIEEVRAVARADLADLARTGPPGRVNRRLVRALGSTGLLGRLFPRPAGGSRSDPVSALELCLVREALALESTEAETAFALQGLGSHPILRHAHEALSARWMPRVVSGEVVAGFALTEPDAGSDAAALTTAAEPAGDGWRISGVKSFISNAPDADLYTLFARTSETRGAKGVTAFAVPGDAPGLTGTRLELLAPHPVGRLELDGVHVPTDHVVGEIGGGFKVAMSTLDLFRPSVGAFAVGMAQAAFDAARDHAADRKAFGRRLRDFQAVSHKLAEMATRVEAARLLVYAAADAYDSGEHVVRASAMAKMYATETAQWVVDAAVQVLGARALEHGHLLEHLYREVRAPRIYEGTTEIQREIIARELYR